MRCQNFNDPFIRFIEWYNCLQIFISNNWNIACETNVSQNFKLSLEICTGDHIVCTHSQTVNS